MLNGSFRRHLLRVPIWNEGQVVVEESREDDRRERKKVRGGVRITVERQFNPSANRTQTDEDSRGYGCWSGARFGVCICFASFRTLPFRLALDSYFHDFEFET